MWFPTEKHNIQEVLMPPIHMHTHTVPLINPLQCWSSYFCLLTPAGVQSSVLSDLHPARTGISWLGSALHHLCLSRALQQITSPKSINKTTQTNHKVGNAVYHHSNKEKLGKRNQKSQVGPQLTPHAPRNSGRDRWTLTDGKNESICFIPAQIKTNKSLPH